MPRIPLYNQGQGPAVQLATGPLSRRADVGAFTAPGQALASFGEKASQIAFQFGEAEKKAETERVYAEKLSEFGQQADDLITNPTAKTVRGFEIEAGEFRTNALANIDGLDGLTNSQKQTIKLNLGKSLDRKLTVGRANVFNRQQADRSTAINDAIESLIPDAANLQMQDVVLANIDEFISIGKAQGLSLNYDEKSVRYEIQKRGILSESTDLNKGLEYHKNKRDDILNGKGQYKIFSAGERSALASMVSSRINYLENGAVAETKAAAKDSLSKIAASGDTTGSEEIYNTYVALGQFELAENYKFDVLVGKKTYETYNPIRLASPATVNAALKEAEKNWKEGSQDQAAENLAVYKNLQELVIKRDAQIKQDPVAYIEGVEGRSLTASERVEKQRTLGLKDYEISPFSKAEFQNLQTRLQNLSAVESISELQAFFAPYVGTEFKGMALRQAIKNGMTYAQNIALTDPGNPRSADLLNAMALDQKVVDDELKLLGIDKPSISMAVNLELDSWKKSVIGGTTDGYLSRLGSAGRIDAINETQKAVLKLAEVYATAGMSYDQAAKAAANIITDKYVFMSGKAGGEVRMPAIIADRASEVMDFLDRRLLDEDYLEGTIFFNKPDATDYEIAQYIKEVRSMGRWVTNAEDSGVYLVDKLGNKVIKRVPVDGVMTDMPIIVNFIEAVQIIDIEAATGIDATDGDRGRKIMEEIVGPYTPMSPPSPDKGVLD